MPLAYLSDDLIESVRNLGMVTDAGTLGGEDSDILRHLNESMSLHLIPRLMKAREEYLVVTTRLTLAGSTLKYRLPGRAIGDKLRMIRYVDTNGNRLDAPIPEIRPERQGDYQWTSTGRPSGWYLEGNYICLVAASVSGFLEISWFFRPGQLVKSSAARKIVAVNPSMKVLTLTAAPPTAWTTGTLLDVHGYRSGAEIKIWDEPQAGTSGSTITLTNPIDGSSMGTHPIEVGDWVCPAGEAVIPALPLDLHPLLAEAANVRIMAALGMSTAVAVHKKLMDDAEEQIQTLITRRTEGRPQRLIGRGGFLGRMGCR